MAQCRFRIDRCRIMDADGAKIARCNLREDPQLRKVRDGKSRGATCLQQLARRDLFLDHDPGHRRTDHSGHARNGAAGECPGDRSTINSKREQRLKSGQPIGFRACGVGLRLGCFALRNAVVRGKVAVGHSKAPCIGGGHRGLAIGRDRSRVIGGLDQRQGLTLADRLPERDQRAHHGTGERRHDRCGLIVVEVDRPGSLDASSICQWNNGVELDTAALRLRQPHIGNAGGGCAGVGRR